MYNRLILIILLFVLPLTAAAQTWTPDNTGVKTTVEVKGGYKFDTSLIMPVRDTIKPSWWNTGKSYDGQIQLGLDGRPYYYQGTSWHSFGSGGGGSGTVTSITSGNGLVSSPNPITTSGTLRVDTGRGVQQIATGGSLNKVRDSLQNNINGKVAYTDTASMLNPYLRKSDTAGLSNRIDQKQNYTDTNTYDATLSDLRDTSGMLRTLIGTKQNALTLTTTGTSGAATLVGATLNIPIYSSGSVTNVTATSPIISSGGTTPNISADTGRGVGQLATGGSLNKVKDSLGAITVKYGDTATMLLPYLRKIDTTTMLSNYLRTASNGLTKSSQDVSLGGSLTGATTITTTGSNTLAIAGLQSGTTNDSLVVSDGTSGVLKRISSARISGGGVTGSGTTSYIPRWTGSTSLGNSLIQDNTTNIGVNRAPNANNIVRINGTIGLSGGTVSDDPGGASLLLGHNGSYGIAQCFGSTPMSISPLGTGTAIGQTTVTSGYVLEVGGNTKIDGTIDVNTTAPSISLGTGAGTGASFSITGSNNNYTVSVTTGTTPAASATVFTVTMSGSFAATGNMAPVFSAANSAAILLTGTQNVYMSGTTTTHVMTSGSVPLGGTYIWNVICLPK